MPETCVYCSRDAVAYRRIIQADYVLVDGGRIICAYHLPNEDREPVCILHVHPMMVDDILAATGSGPE